MPTLKEKGLFKRRCLSSPHGLERHSQSVQPTVDSTSKKVVERLVDQEKLSIDP